jgi:hypothetical protein
MAYRSVSLSLPARPANSAPGDVNAFGGPRARRGCQMFSPDRRRFLGLEVQDRNQLSLHQEHELQAIRFAGGVAKVVRSLDDALRVLRTVDPGVDKQVKVA